MGKPTRSTLLLSTNWPEQSPICQTYKKQTILSLGESEAEVVVNDTLLGQIASFMENLHLLYREVAYEIPYRNLVLMQRDKLHTITGTKVIKGKDMASHRRRNKK